MSSHKTHILTTALRIGAREFSDLFSTINELNAEVTESDTSLPIREIYFHMEHDHKYLLSIYRLKMLSHQSCLVRFKWTSIHFLRQPASFGQVQKLMWTLMQTKENSAESVGLCLPASKPWCGSLR